MILHDDLEQNSEAWFQARCGMPTASKFSMLVTSTGAPSKSMEGYAYDKACEKFAGQQVDPFAGSVWTNAGTDDESAERDKYDFLSDDDVAELGFVTDDEVTCGCSPDSLVGDDGLLELKRLKGSLLIEANLYYLRHNKIQTKYVQQVQGQMMILERKWCDVVFYNPLLPSLTIRVYPDEKVVAGLKAQIKACNKLRDEVLEKLGWE